MGELRSVIPSYPIFCEMRMATEFSIDCRPTATKLAFTRGLTETHHREQEDRASPEHNNSASPRSRDDSACLTSCMAPLFLLYSSCMPPYSWDRGAMRKAAETVRMK
jgi:hypothetical protein